MGGDDVRALLEQEARYRRDDPGPVGAADQQPRGVALPRHPGDRAILSLVEPLEPASEPTLIGVGLTDRP